MSEGMANDASASEHPASDGESTQTQEKGKNRTPRNHRRRRRRPQSSSPRTVSPRNVSPRTVSPRATTSPPPPDALMEAARELLQIFPNVSHSLLFALLQTQSPNDVAELLYALYSEEAASELFSVAQPARSSAAQLYTPNVDPDEMVFHDTRAVDAEGVYASVEWKPFSHHSHHTTTSSTGVIQGEIIDSDTSDTDDRPPQSLAFNRTFQDSWVGAKGDRAMWLMHGRFLNGQEEPAPPAPEEGGGGVDEENEELALLWSQDWEGQSDDEELAKAERLLWRYRNVFPGKKGMMKVGKELRQYRSNFKKERREVLARVANLIQQQVPYRSTGDDEEDKAAQLGIVNTAVALCGVGLRISTDTPLYLERVAIPTNTAKWDYQPGEEDGMMLKVKHVVLKSRPVRVRCLQEKCCCLPCGPCVCADSGMYSVEVEGSANLRFEVSITPASKGFEPRYTKVEMHRVESTMVDTMGCCGCSEEYPEGASSRVSAYFQRQVKKSMCGRWRCAPLQCLYNCIPCCASPLIRYAIASGIEEQVSSLAPPPRQTMT